LWTLYTRLQSSNLTNQCWHCLVFVAQLLLACVTYLILLCS